MVLYHCANNNFKKHAKQLYVISSKILQYIYTKKAAQVSEKNYTLLLNNKDLLDSFFGDARLIGIMGAVKDYRLCWKLNREFNIEFRSSTNLEIKIHRNKRLYYFSLFEYQVPVSALSHYLYNNQYDGEYLIPALKHFDYFWLIKNESVSNEWCLKLIECLKAIPEIQYVIELDIHKIKNVESLLF